MAKKRMPKSICKYIRREKARIRREVLDMKEQEELINKIYQKFLNKEKKEIQPVKSVQGGVEQINGAKK